MSFDSKKVLWGNLVTWMRQRYGKENLNRLARDMEFAPATASRLKGQETGTRLDTLDKLATHMGCQPSDLLQPSFFAQHSPLVEPQSIIVVQKPATENAYMQTTRIRKAVFPVAGLGTRFLPATKASPKEMLPVVDKPLIQYAVEEAYEAGIRDMVFVTGRSKRAIEDHFDTAYELENELEQAGKQEMLALVRSISPADMNCLFVRQPRSLGLGHAVLCAEPLVGNEPFAVLLADDLMVGEPGGPGVMAQMTAAFAKQGRSLLAVQEVPLAHTRRYGIVQGEPAGGALLRIDSIVEKPAPEVAPSRMGVAGRYVLTPRIFEEIRSQPRGVGGEIQLTDAIARLMAHEAVYAYQYEGKRYDCGSKEGFLEATVELALQHPQVGAAFRAYLKGLAL